jgi:hypothetical protein
MAFLMAQSGCGSSSISISSIGISSTPSFVAQILSEAVNDGDIEIEVSNIIHINQGNLPSVFAGIDPVTLSEFRAFLDFPLAGPDGVPGRAIIESATLDIFINSYRSAATSIPIRIELVSFPPQTLLASDFDRIAQPPLASVSASIFPVDVNRHVAIDVTPLMLEAQFRNLVDFQVRIIEDLGLVTPGLVEIDDTTVDLAPLLEVTFR